MSIIQSGYSVEYYARVRAEQERIRRQAETLDVAAQDVKAKLNVFKTAGLLETMYQSDKSSSVFQNFALNAVSALVKSYNSLTAANSSADRLSNEGKELLEQVNSLLTGSNSEVLSNIGIELDKYTGELRFDELKFKETLASDPFTVKKALLGEGYLGPVLQDMIELTLSKPAISYFNLSFTIEV